MLNLSGRLRSDNLPTFRRPPIIETVLGVQFDLLPGLTSAHLGAFWQALGPQWPNVTDAHPLAPEVERFDKEKTWGFVGLQLRLSSERRIRLQIRNQTKDRMIQVQNGRLHYNWLGQDGGEYPTYEKVKPGFDWSWQRFREFLGQQNLDEPKANQWEVAYVNHIPKGELWQSSDDWASLFRNPMTLSPTQAAIRLEGFATEWHYEIVPRLGRLHVNLAHGLRTLPRVEEILILNMTARGPIGSHEGEARSVDEGFDIGHQVIVKAFAEMTSDKAHEHWELIHDAT